jgi:hypothetical protein
MISVMRRIQRYQRNAAGLDLFYPSGFFITGRANPGHAILIDARHSQWIDENRAGIKRWSLMRAIGNHQLRLSI